MCDDFLNRFASSLDGLKEHIDKVRELITSVPIGLTQSTAQGQPGNIVPYELSEEEAPEIPLTPITRYAIQESVGMGPLRERELILLLSQKFDRRLKRTVDVVRNYADDVDGVKNQLENIRNTIQEIRQIENIKSEFLHKRIRKVLAAIRHLPEEYQMVVPDGLTSVPSYELPDMEQFNEILTPAAKLALMESSKYGPLNEENLKMFLCERITNNWKNNMPIIWHYTTDGVGLAKQIESFRNHMDAIEGMERPQTNFLLEQVSKALADLEEELYY